jgi:hypothetical protein
MTLPNLMRIAMSEYLREKILLEAFNSLKTNHHERDDLITLII